MRLHRRNSDSSVNNIQRRTITKCLDSQQCQCYVDILMQFKAAEQYTRTGMIRRCFDSATPECVIMVKTGAGRCRYSERREFWSM